MRRGPHGTTETRRLVRGCSRLVGIRRVVEVDGRQGQGQYREDKEKRIKKYRVNASV